MINPYKVTDYNRTKEQLEEFMLFCILVAGKNADTTAKLLQQLLLNLGWDGKDSPFWLFRKKFPKHPEKSIPFRLRMAGFGCYTAKGRTIYELIFEKRPNLRWSSPTDLEVVYGIGKKTSRYFCMHSRRNAYHAALDVHILRWMSSIGYAVPHYTPSGKRYDEIEKLFLKECTARNQSPAELDLEIWCQAKSALKESKNGV